MATFGVTLMFQSAPRSEDRGEVVWLRVCLRHNVSIRAPIRRPGRVPWRRNRPAIRSFNPRPDPKTGARQLPVQPQRPALVSIRAPIRRPGRGRLGACCARTPRFQSAPRSEDRGELLTASSVAALPPVSIRAPIRRPGRVGTAVAPKFNNKFQSAPRSEDRGEPQFRQT